MELTWRRMEAVVALIQALVWPLVVMAIFLVLRQEVKGFLHRVGQVQLKAGGFEAIATAQQAAESASSLAFAVAKGSGQGTPEQSPEELASQVREIASIVGKAAASPKKLAGGQVLWVDDRPENNVYERQSLEALGLRFTLSTSTEEALDKARSQSFDVIISDMGRPPDQRAGYTLLSKLRENGITTPYIIYSAGSASPEHKAEAAQHGAYGTTDRASDLFQMVIDALRGARAVSSIS